MSGGVLCYDVATGDRGDAALFFDPLNTEEIAAALVKVCTDHEFRDRLKKEGLKRQSLFLFVESGNPDGVHLSQSHSGTIFLILRRLAMVTNPKISIVVPSFNQGGVLKKRCSSLVDQNYRPLEVIIQDGGSTDQSIDVAKRFVEKFPEVFRLFVETDAGQAHGLNRGFERATGDILGFINAGDTLLPGCLSGVAREISPQNGPVHRHG